MGSELKPKEAGNNNDKIFWYVSRDPKVITLMNAEAGNNGNVPL